MKPQVTTLPWVYSIHASRLLMLFLMSSQGCLLHKLNALVRRRNNIHIHFTSREALDKEVADVVGLIDADIRQELKWECKVLDSHVSIKNSIPQECLSFNCLLGCCPVYNMVW